MAKGIYYGVGNVAHKVKKLYRGVDDVARKIKKAYIGIGGIARPFFSGGELAYYGALPNKMQTSRQWPAGASVGDYGLIAGGASYDGSLRLTATVDAYNKSLVRTSASSMTNTAWQFAGTSVGDYAIFAGGSYSTSETYTSNKRSDVTAYNSSLSKSTPTKLLAMTMSHAAASNGAYAIFAGGHAVKNANAYDSSLTRSTLASLPNDAWRNAGASVGNFAMFAGGRGSASDSSSSTAVSYDAEGTQHMSTIALSNKIDSHSAAALGNYMVVAGGLKSGTSNEMSNVDVVDTSLTRVATATLSQARKYMASVEIEGYVVFAGGCVEGSYSSDNASRDAVDIFDSSFTRIFDGEYTYSQYGGAGVTVGDYAIIAGGKKYGGSQYSSDGIVYTVK